MAVARSGSVGLILSNSPEHRDQKTYIGIFKTGAALCFEGCIQLRVLAGVIEIEGEIIKPSSTYHPLFSPSTNSRMVITCLDPNLNNAELMPYLQPLRDKPVVFGYRERSIPWREEITLDLSEEDVKHVNRITVSKEWKKDFSAVVLLKEVKCTLLDALMLYNIGFSNETLCNRLTFLKMFNLMNNLENGLLVPVAYRQLAWDILASSDPSPIVLVCGKKNSGKSTLCRLLVNYMLNRHSMVSFLECDVGQSEFTVPCVVALHSITESVHGPSFTHLRPAEKAYFFGDNTPKLQPDFYISLIKLCLNHYHAHSKDSPLIVNTCGWTNGLGVPIFHDIVRTIKPSHIVQLVLGKGSTESHELPTLNPAYLSSAQGWSLKPDQVLQPEQLVSDIQLFSSMNTKVLHNSRKKITSPNSPILIPSDSEEEVGLSDGEGGESQSEDEEKSRDTSKKVSKRPHSKEPSPTSKKSKIDNEEELIEQEKKNENEAKSVIEKEWSAGLNCRICVVKVKPTKNINIGRRRISKMFRLTSYVVYFSPLLETISSSLSPEVRKNFIMAANPYEVPWNSVAVHSIHRKVPFSQLLYAINGKFVALTRVADEELIDYDYKYTGIFKFIKSALPAAEFLGLGLVRGIDADNKCFYITTPEPLSILRQVNCLVLGNTERPIDLVPQHHILSSCPYLLQHFKHQSCGRLGWNESSVI